MQASSLTTSEECSPECVYAAIERARILRCCIAGLSGRHAELVHLRYQCGLTLLQIAGIFGVREASVAAMHGRVLRNLRAALNRQGVRSLSEIL
jgi:DNA-directed RNA polymerase specialized sigma24 family protein